MSVKIETKGTIWKEAESIGMSNYLPNKNDKFGKSDSHESQILPSNKYY